MLVLQVSINFDSVHVEIFLNIIIRGAKSQCESLHRVDKLSI